VEVKVLDFGIAKLTSFEGVAANTSALTVDGGMLGTPYYMSPEQVDGEKDIDARSDIWALGVILYQCLSGTMPTHGENLGQVFKIITRGTIAPLASLAPDLPAEVSILVSRMMTRDRSERPQSMQEVAAILGPLANLPVDRFSEPRRPVTAESDPLQVSPSVASIDDAPLATRTHAGVARSVPPRRRSAPIVAAASLVFAGAVAAGWLVGPRGRAKATQQTAVALEIEPVAVPAASVSSDPPPSRASSAPPQRLDAPPKTPPAPLTSGLAAPSPASPSRPRPRSTASATPSAPPSPASASSQGPGGVYEQAPY
jgi:serine/threonine-protein kinase